MNTSRDIIFKSIIIPILSIVVIGMLIYSNTLQGEFVSDDMKHIVRESSIRDIGNIKGIWDTFNTRFLAGMSFAFNYWIGGEDVFGYHLFNIVCHIIATLLVFSFIRLTLQTPYFEGKFGWKEKNFLSIFPALIFLCHPLQTQVAAYITQRFVSMTTIIYLSTLIFYIKGRLTGQRSFFIVSFLIMLLGYITKEMIITAPVALLAYELYFFESWKVNLKERIKRLSVYFASLIFLPLMLYQGRLSTVNNFDNIVKVSNFDWKYVFTGFNVLCTNLRMLIFPVNQSHSYDYPISQSFFEVQTLLSFCLLLSLIILAVYLFKRERLLSFCIVWYFITTFAEVTLTVFHHEGVIYDHWLYLPMIGFGIFVTYIFYQCVVNRTLARIILSILVIVLAVMTFQRNKVWQSRLSLWQDIVRKQPSPYHYIILANVYKHAKDFEKAEENFKKSIELDKEWPYVYLNLANFYHETGQLKKALSAYNRVLKMDPNHYSANVSLGVVYSKLGRNRLAFAQFRKAQAIKPEDFASYFFLANRLLDIEEFAEAEENFKLALKYAPHNPEVRYHFGRLYMQKGEYQKAIGFFEDVIARDKNHKAVYNALGVTLMKIGEEARAEPYFLKAVEFEKDNVGVLQNVARYYQKQGDQEKARYYRDKARQLREAGK